MIYFITFFFSKSHFVLLFKIRALTMTKFTISTKFKYIFNHKLKHFKYKNFKLKIQIIIIIKNKNYNY